MKLLNCQNNSERFIGILFENKTLNLTKGIQLFSSLYESKIRIPILIEDLLEIENLSLYLEKVLVFIKHHNLTNTLVVDTYKILPPIIRPSKIIALGRNYLEHAKETGYNAPREPIFFSKAVSSIIGHEDKIVYPTWLTRVDPEVELGVIIGKEAKNIPEENAIDYVLGYTIVNDVTARDMQTEDLRIANPWFRSKSFDTFCPIGPYLVLKEQILNPHNLNIELRVNGNIRQKDNTKNLIFKIPYIISFITRHITLEPGDIIATGTPSGIAPIKPGDVIEAEIEGIGILKNIVIEG
ncbi:MAG: fumarylacetoacetate hydrolase family protein [bacterium]|nr:fumarylacetoacetate hydrolase family protein [bacterium]